MFTHMLPADSHKKIGSVEIYYVRYIKGFSFFDKKGKFIWRIGQFSDKPSFCPNGHSLKRHDFPIDGRDRISCDVCAKKIVFESGYFNCGQGCNYDGCVTCVIGKETVRLADGEVIVGVVVRNYEGILLNTNFQFQIA